MRRPGASFFERHNIHLSREEMHNHVFGRVAKDTLDYIFQKDHSGPEIDAYVDEKEVVYRGLYKDKIALLPGLEDLLIKLQAQGLPMAVATSAPPGNVAFAFDHLPIRHYFEFVLDASDIEKGKPDPEIYRKTIEKLKMDPDRCIVFEDSLPGVQAARGSGAHVIAVATTHAPEEFSGVRTVVQDFRELDYEKLTSLIAIYNENKLKGAKRDL